MKKYRFKRRHRVGPRCDIVHGNTPLRLGCEAIVEQEAIRHLRNTLVAAVGSPKVDVGGPVVRKIIGRVAGGAGGDLGDVGHGHGDVEGISSHDLMHVWRRRLAGVDQRVQTLNGDLRTAEPEVVQAVHEALGISQGREE